MDNLFNELFLNCSLETISAILQRVLQLILTGKTRNTSIADTSAKGNNNYNFGKINIFLITVCKIQFQA